jgi:hypothetical protein
VQPCSAHWARMREIVSVLGLSEFCSDSKEESLLKLFRILESESLGDDPPPDNFDPMTLMMWVIVRRAIDLMGFSFLAKREDEDDGMPENRDILGGNHYCPLCILRREFDLQRSPQDDTPWDDLWIAACGDYVFRFAKHNRLICLN